MAFQFVLIFIISRYLRRYLQTAEKFPKWDNILKWVTYASIALFVLTAANSPVKVFFERVAPLIMLAFLYFIYKEPVFKPARFIIVAVLPFVLLLIISNILELIDNKFYEKWDDAIGISLFFSFVWGMATWWMTSKQRKALDTERKKTKQEEEQNKVISAMKNQLEIQVAERTIELTRQKEELQLALNELKATQAQLIQAEKMASLGELTAGIAHEIQNPLNFVNNFSEVSVELANELKEELNRINLSDDDKANVEEIINDIVQNQEKINLHGKRADGIVKGMLQHSRSSSGQKELTDINALADEYFRLSFHGLRAKDKTFNATMKTDFDTTLTPVSIVPQEIGRVILNLITNAFYSVTQKKSQHIEGYEPTVYVSTKKLPDAVEITVKDNGTGIPQKALDKIFQPFFTTKPSGQGTGLGLSLSYDIITKAHGGTLQVNTKEGEGAEFIIHLPIK
ncbi:MAG: ATP-binding protein [Agriterribacter sp.]